MKLPFLCEGRLELSMGRWQRKVAGVEVTGLRKIVKVWKSCWGQWGTGWTRDRISRQNWVSSWGLKPWICNGTSAPSDMTFLQESCSTAWVCVQEGWSTAVFHWAGVIVHTRRFRFLTAHLGVPTPTRNLEFAVYNTQHGVSMYFAGKWGFGPRGITDSQLKQILGNCQQKLKTRLSYSLSFTHLTG